MMRLLSRARTATQRYRRDWAYLRSKRHDPKYDARLSIADIARQYPTPNEQWKYFHHFFWNLAPEWLREHRAFFASDRRGFGEDAIHAMWYLLLTERRPSHFLEIGVYRGQVISLVKLVALRENFPCRVLGVSPFTPLGDSVSVYGDFDYRRDVGTFCDHFGTQLSADELLQALSTDSIAESAIASRRWSIAYVDGNHDYPVARHDFDMVSAALAHDGVVVLDDAGLETGYRPASFSFAGHPGPSRVLSEATGGGWRPLIQAGHNVVVQPPHQSLR